MLAAEQAARGHEVHIGLRRTGVHVGLLRGSAVAVHCLADGKGVSLRLLRNVDALMHEAAPHIVQTWLAQMDILGGIAALKNGVPWIVSERVSELAFREHQALWWVRSRIARHARAVVANSTTGAAYWRRVGPADLLVRAVPNAVDVNAIRATPMPAKDHGLGRGKLVLVVGRLTHQKAVEITVRAVAIMADRTHLQVRVIGDGPLRAELQAAIDSAGLGAHIQIMPYQLQWWGLLKSASVLVSMSRYEGHSNVVLETMASGCPLIVSDIPEHREFLDDACAMFVPRDDARALADALTRVLSDPVSARQRAECAGGRVNSLTIGAAARAYESIYNEVSKEG